jgi:hypothetical protein
VELAPELVEILSPAYGPCPRFADTCAKMVWNPKLGFVPRGFFGASGNLSEVELVLVSGEPGDPWEEERDSSMERAYEITARVISNAPSMKGRQFIYHRNIRRILDMCWEGLPFEEQLRKVWITDSVLCSALKEGGNVASNVSRTCGREYLLPQLKLFPKAVVAALGSKAKNRLLALGITDFVPARAAAPRGCNYPDAKQTWRNIALALQERRDKY